MALAIASKIIGYFDWQDTKYPLHCAELLVNVVRDEKTWRCAGNRSRWLRGEPGLSRALTNALHALLVSGPALTLFCTSPSSNGSSAWPSRPTSRSGSWPPIIYLSLGAVLLAFFVSACAFWQPKGPQQATVGHLQALVDLIDEWPEVGETMFWGRKEGEAVKSGSNKDGVQADISALRDEVLEEDLLNTKSIAHAGTAATMLDEIRHDGAYMSSQIG